MLIMGLFTRVCAKADDALQNAGAKQTDTPTNRLKRVEAVMDRYYRGDPINKAKDSLNRSIDQHNRWVESTNAQHQAAHKNLEKEFDSLQAIEKQIAEMDKRLAVKPDTHDQTAVKDYNAAVDRRNNLVKQYNELGKSYKARETAFNDKTSRANQELETRKKQLDAQRATVEQQIASYAEWCKTGDDVAFFKDLNRFFAQLCKENLVRTTPELIKTIDKVRAIRRELAEHAIKSPERAGGGLVIVEATLCRREKCFLIVDTGATDVCIPPALVDVLGLTDKLGKEVEARLAGGVRIRGRELVIPQVSVLGREVKDVKAVVLDESEVGVDGLLGLSFLNNFDFHIDQHRPDKLILKPK
jgi:clan AA aspartic protease (TIGR02281 family)